MVIATSTVTTAVIAAGAAILAAVLTLLGTVVTARSKLAALELKYQQKRADAHLQSARGHIDTIYIPLSQAVSQLTDAFLVLRSQTGVAGEVGSEDVAQPFREACDRFLARVRETSSSGKEAFLTADLDAGLTDFAAFLGASRTASEVTGKAVFRASAWPVRGSLERTLSGPRYHAARIAASLSVFTIAIGTSVEVPEVVAAPFTSRAFEERFQRDTAAIRRSIRDVTLGPESNA